MTPIKCVDAQLQAEVLAELASDPLITPASVGVEVAAGIVTLSGITDCWAKKHAADLAAHRVRGVRDVANAITVRPSWATGTTDAEIAATIRRALQADPLVPHERIQTTVESGIVTLAGTVLDREQREEATRAIERLVGVRCVNNALTVAP